MLHFLEGEAFGFGVKEHDDEELDDHHGGEKYEGIGAGSFRDDGKERGDEGIHDPVRGAAQALTFGANGVGKYFADVNPDDRAERSEKENVADQNPDEAALVLLGKKNLGHAGQAESSAGGADQEQGFASKLVNQGHGQERSAKIHGADGDGLQIAGQFAEPGGHKNSGQVVEDGIDAGELVEDSGGDREKNRVAKFAGKQRLGALRFFQGGRVHNFGELGFIIRRA